MLIQEKYSCEIQAYYNESTDHGRRTSRYGQGKAQRKYTSPVRLSATASYRWEVLEILSAGRSDNEFDQGSLT